MRPMEHFAYLSKNLTKYRIYLLLFLHVTKFAKMGKMVNIFNLRQSFFAI